jgi:CobQ/CobB/MinD/ParA nucleotide binding domain
MVEADFNSVATAIRGAELEGFIASTLFSQGWSVTVRALDIQSLLDYLDSNAKKTSLLLISTDIDGLTQQSLEEIKKRGVKFFLFAATASANDDFPDSVAPPTTSLELLGLIRGSLRSPMIRSTQREKIRARTIAIASPTGSVGCTTLTINLGAELAALGKKVLIIDAHAYFPAFALRLGLRGLNSTSEFCAVSPGLWALEVTQAEISTSISSLDRARLEFDFILIDHGTIRDFPAILTGRRWCNETFIWISTHADELWIMSKQEHLAAERLKVLTSELARNTIKPQLSFIQNQSTLAKRKKSEGDPFLAIVTPLRPVRIVQYPWDPRSTLAAEEERVTLLESNERGSLRKSIEHLAGELVS